MAKKVPKTSKVTSFFFLYQKLIEFWTTILSLQPFEEWCWFFKEGPGFLPKQLINFQEVMVSRSRREIGKNGRGDTRGRLYWSIYLSVHRSLPNLDVNIIMDQFYEQVFTPTYEHVYTTRYFLVWKTICISNRWKAQVFTHISTKEI